MHLRQTHGPILAQPEVFIATLRGSLLLLSLLLLTSCCDRLCNFDVYGADEFVIDSYKIRQGKLAILEMEGKDIGDLPYDAMEEYEDVITEDDILKIGIYHPTRKDLMEAIQQLNEKVGFRVRNGHISLPDIAKVSVAGLTLDEAQERIKEIMRAEVGDVEVFLDYSDRLTRKVDLAGLVSVPYLPVDGKMRLYEVIAAARLPPSANLFMSYVMRDYMPLAIDLHALMNEGDLAQNIVMRGGDKIFIAEAKDSRVMVMGEVAYPKAVNLPYGFISIREALVEAGGIPFTGDRSCIQVIRGNLICPKIYNLSWCHITHLPNDSLLLMPGDTVYVSEKPITQWNRFISQLLPTIAIFKECQGCYMLIN